MTAPKRIQRKRIKDWRMPENTVSVCRPGRYGNPYPVTETFSAEQSVKLFRTGLNFMKYDEPEKYKALIDDLHGKDVACFCAEDAEF